MIWKPHKHLATSIQNYKEDPIRELNNDFFFPWNINIIKET